MLQELDVLRGFSRAAEEDPARIALEQGARRLSYGELDAWSDALAWTLAGGPPRAVAAIAAITVPDPVERVVAILGAWKAGCAFAPIDLDQPAPALARLLAHVQPGWWIGAAAPLLDCLDRGLFPGGHRPFQCRLDPERRTAIAEPCDPAPSPARPANPSLGPDDLAYLVPTSGSTGAPKWIAGRYKGIGHFVAWESDYLGLGPGVRVSQLTSPYFDAYLRDLFLPLTRGGTLAIPDTAELRLDAEALADWLDRAEIEVVHCVPSLFHLLSSADLHPRRFERLRAVLLAGEPPLAADLARWFGVFGERVRIVNLYGPSETTMTKLVHEIRPADLDRPSIPIGRPIPGCAVLLVDARDRPCAPGTVGEILLRTPYRSLGYYKEPRQTALRFVPNPWGDLRGDPDDLVYKTGDLGRLLPDGELQFLGRRDQQVKIRGQRIELGEVESALLALPAVRAAAAVARPDAQGLPSLWAFVVPASSSECQELSPHEIRSTLARTLPAQLLPDRIVPLAALPQTRNGKIDRRALAALDTSGAGGQSTAPRVPPRTPTESRIAAIWQEVIGIAESGVEDDFFAAGGHSLLATRLLLLVRAETGVSVPLRDFLEQPTIASLSDRVDEATLLAADPDELRALLATLDAETSPVEPA